MRRLTTTLTVFLITVLTHAQVWTMVDARQYNDETIVYAAIYAGSTDSPDEWMVGAFIDQECRGEATSPAVGPDGSRFFILRVYGDHDADRDKPITFAVCNKSTQKVYDCHGSEPVTFNGESFGSPSTPILLTFSSTEIPLQGFIVSIDPMVAGQPGQLQLTPVPADATFRISDVTPVITANGYFGAWNTVSCELQSREPLLFNISSDIPCQYQLAIGDVPLYQADGQTPFTGFEVAAPLNLKQGWQWRTNSYGDVTAANFEQVYGANALTEIRTQENLLYNDPTWGYFGTLMEAGLPQNMPYKVRMAKELNSRLTQGHYTSGYTVTVSDGWTWIPSPYYFDHQLSAVFNPSQLLEGMVIISKERGSAEWDGNEWIGDLQVLPAYESFLCYAYTEAPFALTYRPEAEMTALTAPAGARSLDTAPWHYDATRFRDNMTLVMQLPQLEQPADYSIGAFVGGECRGEGHFVTGHRQANGYFFTTVHCNQGERISFRLCHQPSGRQYTIDQMATSTDRRLGSLRQPLSFTSQEQATALNKAASTATPHVTQTYDLTGRKVRSSRRGLLIQQLSDGTVRRIIR